MCSPPKKWHQFSLMHATRGASRCCSHLSTAGLDRLSVSASHGIFFFFFFFFCDTYQLILRPVAKLACVWLHGPLTVALVLIRLCLTRVSVVVVLLIHRRIQTAYAASNYLFTGGGLCVQYFTVCLTHVVNVSGIVLPWAPRTQKLKSPSAEISGL